MIPAFRPGHLSNPLAKLNLSAGPGVCVMCGLPMDRSTGTQKTHKGACRTKLVLINWKRARARAKVRRHGVVRSRARGGNR